MPAHGHPSQAHENVAQVVLITDAILRGDHGAGGLLLRARAVWWGVGGAVEEESDRRRAALRADGLCREPGAVVVALRAEASASAAAGKEVCAPRQQRRERRSCHKWPEWHPPMLLGPSPARRLSKDTVRVPPAELEWCRSRPRGPFATLDRRRTSAVGVEVRSVHDVACAALCKHRPSRRWAPPHEIPPAPDPHHHQQDRHHRAAPFHRLPDARMGFHKDQNTTVPWFLAGMGAGRGGVRGAPSCPRRLMPSPPRTAHRIATKCAAMSTTSP